MTATASAKGRGRPITELVLAGPLRPEDVSWDVEVGAEAAPSYLEFATRREDDDRHEWSY
jgi:hypothetical protein